MDHAPAITPYEDEEITSKPAILAALARAIARSVSVMHMRCSLGRLSDAHLRDIGLTRSDVEAAVRFKPSRDAADDLAARARRRRGNW